MPIHNDLQIDFIDYDQESIILNYIENMKSPRIRAQYRLLLYIMVDCGARVSEACSIRLHQINVTGRILKLNTLKKRERGIYRDVPMTNRVVEALAAHWGHLKDKKETAFLFPSGSHTGYINRVSVWKVFKRASDRKVHPHLLRHTCFTRIAAAGTDIHTIKALAGHSSIAMTEQYVHASEDAKRLAIRAIDQSPWYNRIYRKYFPVKGINVLPIRGTRSEYQVGRMKEFATIVSLTNKKVNIYLQGPQGIGKSQILDNLQTAAKKQTDIGKFLRIDDLKGLKKSIQNLILYLCNGDKAEIAALLYNDLSDYDQIVTKESTKRLCDILIKLTKRHEYTIVVDDATKITPAGVEVLERLNHHFHMIVAARNIKMTAGSFLSNFQKIELQPLQRNEALELIRLDTDFKDRIEDYEQYKNHIWNSTAGNPLFTLEMIDRFRKEEFIGDALVTGVRHSSALREIDISVFLLMALGSLMILRYIGGEFDDDKGAYKLFGGAFMIFALFARNIFNVGKRTYV